MRVPKRALTSKTAAVLSSPALQGGNLPAGYWASGILATICLAAYSNSFHAGFHLDDFDNILNNFVVHRIDIKRILHFFPERFIPYLSFSLNFKWSHLQPSGYHVINLAIHWLSSVVAWQLTRLTFRT